MRGIFSLVLVSYEFGFGLPLRNSVSFLILLAYGTWQNRVTQATESIG